MMTQEVRDINGALVSSQSYAYDTAGNQLLSKDALGNQTSSVYSVI